MTSPQSFGSFCQLCAEVFEAHEVLVIRRGSMTQRSVCVGCANEVRREWSRWVAQPLVKEVLH